MKMCHIDIWPTFYKNVTTSQSYEPVESERAFNDLSYDI